MPYISAIPSPADAVTLICPECALAYEYPVEDITVLHNETPSSRHQSIGVTCPACQARIVLHVSDTKRAARQVMVTGHTAPRP